MSSDLSLTPTPPRNLRPPSTQLRAVLTIIEADPYLKNNVLPWIDLNNETIHWDQIFKLAFGSGHRAAMLIAYSIWTDEVRPRSNPFGAALSMGPNLQAACLRALAVRWGIAMAG